MHPLHWHVDEIADDIRRTGFGGKQSLPFKSRKSGNGHNGEMFGYVYSSVVLQNRSTTALPGSSMYR
jgi:hypothetical protein